MNMPRALCAGVLARACVYLCLGGPTPTALGHKALPAVLSLLCRYGDLTAALPQTAASFANMGPPYSEDGDMAVVFMDIQGSASLWARCPEAMQRAMLLYDTLLRDMLSQHEGREVKAIGDAFLVLFASVCNAVYFCCNFQEVCVRRVPVCPRLWG